MPTVHPFTNRRDYNDRILDRIDAVVVGMKACLAEAEQVLAEARAERSRGDSAEPGPRDR